jgi:hypothetical protein
MTVSGVSSSTVTNYQNSPFAEFRQTFMQMAKAIKSGDLSGAQQAYATLSQLQSGAPANDGNSPFSQALGQIGEALKNGDLTGAQQALDALGQQAHGAHHHHRHHHAADDDGSTTPAAADGGAASGANSVDLTA